MSGKDSVNYTTTSFVTEVLASAGMYIVAEIIARATKFTNIIFSFV